MSFELIGKGQRIKSSSIIPKKDPTDVFRIVIPVIESTNENINVLDVTLVEIRKNEWYIEKIENEVGDYNSINDPVKKINELYYYLSPKFEEMLKRYKLAALFEQDGLFLGSPTLVRL
ncbi:hypothetical protein [Ornithinibacillus halotolerans]|uniref:Uncharacterized protein n=1 Tax=Ornithinibacillus halotolerans TaxID=1274357 RepID=A0A916RSJ4_9BACI|nr:hypothetical protein [Ornithinibacillus halotolerans]GGA65354.1 hypothetical protein GCM10008025_06510 [Ornithinibacillus halotolerans]